MRLIIKPLFSNNIEDIYKKKKKEKYYDQLIIFPTLLKFWQLFRYFLRKFQQTQTTEKNFSFTFIFLPQRILHSIRTYYLYDKIPNRREGESPSAVIQFPLSFLDPFVARIDESFVSNSCKTMIEGGWPWSSEWKPECAPSSNSQFFSSREEGKGREKKEKGKKNKKKRRDNLSTFNVAPLDVFTDTRSISISSHDILPSVGNARRSRDSLRKFRHTESPKCQAS